MVAANGEWACGRATGRRGDTVIVGVDVGTTVTKAVGFDGTGAPVLTPHLAGATVQTAQRSPPTCAATAAAALANPEVYG
jgi:hypothetical protein